MVKRLVLFIVLVGLFQMVGCSSSDDSGEEGENYDFEVVESSLERDSNPAVSEAQLQNLVEGNTNFAFDLYHQLDTDNDNNLFYSPYSISVALGMTSAGAANNTLTEMETALNFYLDQTNLHPAFNALDLDIQELGTGDPDEFSINIANAIWQQVGYNFEQEFIDTLAQHYGGGIYLLDFATDPEGSRKTINDWVEDKTNDKIVDLLKQGMITNNTRAVLTNAIYFKADWLEVFNAALTEERDFYLLDGSTVQVDTMEIEHSYPVYYGTNYSAVELPYKGDDTAMLIILPEEGEFDNVEQTLDASMLQTIVDNKSMSPMTLYFPKFSYSYDLSLNQVMKDLGMNDAFEECVADFSRMNSESNCLYISDIVHQAFVAVDEKGTEAAAATAVVISNNSAPPSPFSINRPFIFMIRDKISGTIFFMGRVIDPS
jgi:serpin B